MARYPTDTMKKAKRSKLDLIYDFCIKCKEPRNQMELIHLISSTPITFHRYLEICLKSNFIKDYREKYEKVHYYNITEKGNEFIILYEKMSSNIERMNLMIREI